jgi:hypothetical protein
MVKPESYVEVAGKIRDIPTTDFTIRGAPKGRTSLNQELDNPDQVVDRKEKGRQLRAFYKGYSALVQAGGAEVVVTPENVQLDRIKFANIVFDRSAFLRGIGVGEIVNKIMARIDNDAAKRKLAAQT